MYTSHGQLFGLLIYSKRNTWPVLKTGQVLNWGVKYKHISWFICHPVFIPGRRNGGQTGGDIRVYIEFIAARLPTLQILGEKKVLKIPEI